MAYTIETQGLVKAFGETRVLDGLDLQVDAGEVFALLGPERRGKDDDRPHPHDAARARRGIARVAGHDVAREPDAVRAAISLTAQEAAVDGMLTGAENLRMMARLRGVKPSRRGRAARRASTSPTPPTGASRSTAAACVAGSTSR